MILLLLEDIAEYLIINNVAINIMSDNERKVDPLRFAGERDHPSSLEDVNSRMPIPATKSPPDELVYATQHKFVYVNAEQRPELRVEAQPSAKTTEGITTWRIDLPQDKEGNYNVIYGNTALKEKPEVFLKSINPNISFSGYKPDWMNLSFSPRIFPQYGTSLRRFNGRFVKPLYVFGTDDRLPYRDTTYPWGLVGKIYNSQGYTGSGALVWGNIVVTAGHMVPWGQSPWWMRFVPDYYDGSSLFGAGVESYVSDARGFDVGSVTGYDWAILRLYEPLGNWLGFFGSNGYSSDWNDIGYWTLLGYPGAIANGQRPSYQSGVSVFDTDSDSNGGLEIETKADATPGNSGGPFFGWWGDDPRIVGVVSGEDEDYVFPWYLEKGNVMAGGSGFTNLISWGRTNW
jgi:hypothetical protein